MVWIGITVIVMMLMQMPFGGFACNRQLGANRLFIYGILIMVVMNSLGLAIYTRELKSSTIIFYCACVIAFCCGALLVGRISFDQQNKSNQISNVEYLVLRVCFVLAVTYIALTLPQVSKVLTSSISDLRKEHWDSAYDEKGGFGVIYALARAGAGFYMICIPQFFKEKRTLSVIIGLFSAALIFVETAAAGGRYVFLFFSLATAINYYAQRNQASQTRLKFAYIIMGFVVLYFVLAVFPLIRNPYLASEPMPYFAYVDDVVPAPWILQLSSGTLRNHLIGFSFTTTYLTVTPYKLQFYIENMRAQHGLMLGSYNIKYLSFMPRIFGIDTPDFVKMREYISDISYVAGYSGNPWSTGFRDLYLDFGKVGSVFASLFLGYFLTKWSSFVYNSTNTIERSIGAIASCSGLVFSFLSPFVVPPVLNLLLLLLVFAVLARTFSQFNAIPLKSSS
jgi:hypothetical protein